MKRLAACLALLVSASALAQPYPSRAIKLVVPFAPDVADGIAQPFADKLSSVIGQPVQIEYRLGEAGDDGAAYVARQPANGYTVLFGGNFLATNPSRTKSRRYDTLKDFTPVSKVGTAPLALAVNPGVKAKDFRSLVALSKERPLSFATTGTGSLAYLAGAQMNLEGALNLAHVPHKSTNAALRDVVDGRTALVIAPLFDLAPFIKAGELRGIVVLGPKPSRILPGLPALAEAGGPNINFEIWYGLFVRSGTPAELLKRLNQATREAVSSQDFVERIRRSGYEPEWSRPDVLANQVRNNSAKWERVVREAGIPRE